MKISTNYPLGSLLEEGKRRPKRKEKKNKAAKKETLIRKRQLNKSMSWCGHLSNAGAEERGTTRQKPHLKGKIKEDSRKGKGQRGA